MHVSICLSSDVYCKVIRFKLVVTPGFVRREKSQKQNDISRRAYRRRVSQEQSRGVRRRSSR